MFRRTVLTLRVFIFILFLIILLKYVHLNSFECPSMNKSYSTEKSFYSIGNVTEDEETTVDDYSIWCLNMGYRVESEMYLPRSPILQSPPVNSSKLNRFPYRYSLWKSSPILSRRINRCEHHLIMRLLMIIERICRSENISYMLCDGSLLGSWRHHDIIPWDDDIDLMIPIEAKERFVNSMERINETLVKYSILTSKKGKRIYYKVSLKNTPSAGSYDWNFPFVDVFLYVQNRTHLWQIGDRKTAIRLKYVFPLLMRPFGELWIPSPRRPDRIFHFDPYDECKGHFWNHKLEEQQEEITMKCDELKEIYPFVHRNFSEILIQNHSIIHTIIYP